MKTADLLFALAWALIGLILFGLFVISIHDAHVYKI
jgi:hypothetical protein